MKVLPWVALPFLLSSCGMISSQLSQFGEHSQSLRSRIIQPGGPAQACPSQLPPLNQAIVPTLNLTTPQQVSERIQPGSSVAYRFEAEVGDLVRYRSLDNLCFWLLDPAGQVLTSQQIPSDGRYTLRVGSQSRQGIPSFGLELELLRSETDVTPEVAQGNRTSANTADSLFDLPPDSPDGLAVPNPEDPSFDLPAVTASAEDALQTFETYFQLIQQNDTWSAWTLLTPGFQNFWGDYNSYDTFWQSFSSISYDLPRLVGSLDNGVWVEAEVEFVRPSGTTLDNPDNRFYLAWDAKAEFWQLAPSPRQFVIQYFRNINQRNYAFSWDSLDPSFRLSTYEEYLDWWNSVAKVEIGSTELLSYLQNRAFVRVALAFEMNNGSRIEETLEYQVRFIPEDMGWRFFPFDS
ncbi:MAG: hypothetical protein ACFCU9_11085 [Cyanophyceae cyanobacterium]